jgi:hypothetical protein
MVCASGTIRSKPQPLKFFKNLERYLHPSPRQLIPEAVETDPSAARSKNFSVLVRAVRQHLPVIIKSFLVFFFKKELLASSSRRGSDIGQP